MDTQIQQTFEQLKQTISFSTSPFHTAKEAMRRLNEAGFVTLDWDSTWELVPGGKYAVCPFGTTVFGFQIGTDLSDTPVWKLSSSHIDNPGFRIKYNPVVSSKNGCRLNTEVYGGAIYSTWLDRPLSIAGRIALKNPQSAHPRLKLVDFKRPVAVLPNLAIHLNRAMNDGVALNAQTDLLPICGMDEHMDTDTFLQILANETGEKPEDILCFDLSVYHYAEPMRTGFSGDMFMAPRIDNISSVQACLTGLIEANPSDGISVAVLFDHEEIGSRSKNGANGNLLSYTLERICNALNISRENFLQSLVHSYYLSLDVAHAIHPAHPEKSDITSAMPLNRGFAIKASAKHAYCSDDDMTGVILQLAARHHIACQQNHMRNDYPGGSTVGPMVAANLPMCSADIGIPIYAMHSAMETAGMKDQYDLEAFMKAFYKEL